jgi:hypothetical protein
MIALSYSTGDVQGGSYVGGLVGRHRDGRVVESYSTGRVSGTDAVGGLVGGNHGSIDGCFWDVSTSGQSHSEGGVGLITTDMQNVDTYLVAGWDLSDETANGTCDIWWMSPGEYPRLHYNMSEKPDMPEGSGTIEEPYLVQEASDLCTVWLDPMACYQLEASLDLSKNTWATALVPWFGGVLDGNSNVISNLCIRSSNRYVGLFGQLGSEAEISHLGLELLDIEGTDYHVGGLAGVNRGRIFASYSTGVVQGTGMCTAGLVGYNRGSIAASYSTGTIVGGQSVGGLVGANSYGAIDNCYSAGAVSGEDSIGGLVGHSTGGDITASFWDIENSGQTTSAVGTGLPTSGMQTAATFLEAGWDFIDESENGTDDIWWILEGQDYPRLWWELEE